MTHDVWLASGSPRRRELLAQIGVRFDVIAAAVDETRLAEESPESYVRRLAIAKARAGDAAVQASGERRLPVIGADTSVVLGDTVLGKPADARHAEDMLLSLAGREHRVLTAVAVFSDGGSQVRVSDTRVRFRPITAGEAQAYWRTGEPADKAGGYGIQGFGGVFVESLTGSYSGVVGLPIFETTELLKLYKVPHWQ
jgi:septum formation protein